MTKLDEAVSYLEHVFRMLDEGLNYSKQLPPKHGGRRFAALSATVKTVLEDLDYEIDRLKKAMKKASAAGTTEAGMAG